MKNPSTITVSAMFGRGAASNRTRFFNQQFHIAKATTHSNSFFSFDAGVDHNNNNIYEAMIAALIVQLHP
jgi:hypothetical protein